MRQRRTGRQGQSLIEFCFILPFTVSLILSLYYLGSEMILGLQVTQIARDAASMYSRGTDFTPAVGVAPNTTTNSILPNLAGAAGSLDPATGTGVIIFSRVQYLGNNICPGTAGAVCPCTNGSGDPASDCTNWKQFVFTQQYAVGKTSLRASNFGTPPDVNVAPANPGSYNIPAASTASTAIGYGNHTADRAYGINLPAPNVNGTSNGFQPDQSFYVVEAFFTGGHFPGLTLGGAYAYAIF
jgi:hypothetical protein